MLLRREVYKSLVACLCRLSATAAETPTNKKQLVCQSTNKTVSFSCSIFKFGIFSSVIRIIIYG